MKEKNKHNPAPNNNNKKLNIFSLMTEDVKLVGEGNCVRWQLTPSPSPPFSRCATKVKSWSNF